MSERRREFAQELKEREMREALAEVDQLKKERELSRQAHGGEFLEVYDKRIDRILTTGKPHSSGRAKKRGM